MPTMSKEVLSGSTNGRGILVNQTTSGSAVTIHTATTGGSNTDIDEIFIYASNPTSTQRLLTIEFGGNTSVADEIAVQVPAQTTLLVVPGLILRAGLVVKAFCADNASVTLHGFVNRIDQS